jgi:hypothetical protein
MNAEPQIEAIGADQLDAADRAILNKLFQHARGSGRPGAPDVESEITLAALLPLSPYQGPLSACGIPWHG